MTDFRYDNADAWLKGNTHIHSTASDGGKTFAELAAMYAGRGYDFLCRADHWVCSDVAAETEDYPLLWLDGIELNGFDRGGSGYHVVCLGRFKGLVQEMGVVAAMEAARAQGGWMVLAHPFWMGNDFPDALRYGFDAVEIYNHVCQWLNGKGDALAYWHAMLSARPETLALAVDDAHVRDEHPGWDGGWIRVGAAERSREAIMAAIRAGRYYSTRGPEFHEIRVDGRTVSVRTSPAQFIRVVGAGTQGQRAGSFDPQEQRTDATFDVPEDWPYAYVEVQDPAGRRAWTNNLFAPER